MNRRAAGGVEFRINGLDEQRVRRMRPRPHSGWIAAAALVVVTGISGGLAGTGGGNTRGDAGPGAASDPGVIVRGDRVVVIADNSTSLTGDPDRTALRDAQIASLRRQHQVLGQTIFVDGWAISEGRTGYSFLQPLENALARYRDVDTVYFISDFAAADDEDNDVTGRQRLERVLREQGVRLYLATAALPVPVSYRELALESGGLIITP